MINKRVLFLLFIILSFELCCFAENKPKKQQKNVVLSDNAFCENQSSAFYITDNINVIAKASKIVNNISEEDCLNLCANNQDQKKRLVFCASIAYDPKKRTCSIYRKSRAPDGDLLSKTDNGIRFFEKFCLADDLPASCEGKSFIRVDEYILKGYAQSTSVVPTLAECVAQCVREKEFQCKSAMYFYEEGECITNIESAITQPDDFMKLEDDDKVVFFHNGCLDQNNFSISENNDDFLETNSEEQIQIETKEKIPNEKFLNLNINENKNKEQQSNENFVAITTTEQSTTTKQPTTTTEQPTTKKTTEQPTTTEQQTTVKIFKSETLSNNKLSIKKNIKVIPTTIKPNKSEKFDISENKNIKILNEENAFHKHTIKNIETHLYDAKQLEKTADGLIQEKVIDSSLKVVDNGPERPPSGQVVVEDMVEDKENIFFAKLGVDEKSAQKLKSSISFQTVSDKTENASMNLGTLVAPRASVPKILIDNDSNSKGNKEVNKKLLFESKKEESQQLKSNDISSNEVQKKQETALNIKNKSEPTKQLHLKQIKSQTEDFFGPWSDWTPCVESGEQKIRKRKCFDLRECKGPLMQIDYCPQNSETNSEVQLEELLLEKPKQHSDAVSSSPIGPLISPLPISNDNTLRSAGSPPSIMPPKMPEKELKPLPEGAPGHAGDVWSPWLGSCQNFVSAQPCRNNQIIGFESRECIAKNPKVCKGPFFRYCTLAC